MEPSAEPETHAQAMERLWQECRRLWPNGEIQVTAANTADQDKAIFAHWNQHVKREEA